MPRVSEIGVPVARAVLTPIGVDLGPGGEGLQAIGAAVSGIGKVQQLLDRKMQNQIDIGGRIDSASVRSVTDTDIERLLFESPDSTTWEDIVRKRFAQSSTELSKIDMSDETRAIQVGLLEADLQEKLATIQGRAVVKKAADNRFKATAELIKAMGVGKPDEILLAEQNLRDILDDTISLKEEKDEIIKDVKEKGTEEFVKTVAGVGFDAWKRTVTKENPAGDLTVAFAAIDNMNLPEADKQNAESQMRVRVQNRRAENTFKLEAQQEQQLDDINQLIYFDKNYDAAMKAVDASALDEKAQSLLFADIQRRAAAAVKHVDIVTDRSVFERLYNDSLGIWKGSVNKRDFNEDLRNNSRFLGDEDYQELLKSAANTLKTSQASALSLADKEAGRLLVNHVDEPAYVKFLADSMRGMKPDAAKLFESEANEIRQLQFWNLSLYNKDLRQWIADNPDKLGREFAQYANQQKMLYWNKSIDEVRAEKEKGDQVRATLKRLQAESDKAKEKAAESPPTPPTITTQAAYDKLPTGARYIDRNGRVSVKR